MYGDYETIKRLAANDEFTNHNLRLIIAEAREIRSNYVADLFGAVSKAVSGFFKNLEEENLSFLKTRDMNKRIMTDISLSRWDAPVAVMDAIEKVHAATKTPEVEQKKDHQIAA